MEKSDVFVEKRTSDISSTVRKATAKEKAEAETQRAEVVKLHKNIDTVKLQLNVLMKELEKVQKHCPHKYVQDEWGWPYDYRECYVCGKGLGLI